MIDEFDEKKDEIIDTKIDRSYWNDPEVIKDYFDDHTKSKNESNGIVEVRYGNEIYKTWKVKFIRPLITKFLKEKYPDSLVIPEIDKIDISIFDYKSNEIIPIEIQKTILTKNRFFHAEFEQRIRKQIETNIKYSEKCWFFMDSEYLRYLQNNEIRLNSDIDMKWLIELIKENTLKSFAIKYNGIIKELTIDDFEYIKLSEDQIILNTNKLKIFKNTIYGYKFIQKEIDQFLEDFDKHHSNGIGSTEYFLKNSNIRCNLYGNILNSVQHLNVINNTLNMNYEYESHGRNKQYITALGIFDIVGTHGTGNLIRFVDKFDICKYFPGYIKNKDQWESYRNSNLTHETFTMITNGLLKFNKTMKDF